MSDEADGIAKGAGLASGVLLAVGVLWKQFLSRADKNEERVEADKEARLQVVEKRVQGISDDYKERLSRLELRLENVDTRLKSREGLQGRQHTGVTKLTPEQRAILQGFDNE